MARAYASLGSLHAASGSFEDARQHFAYSVKARAPLDCTPLVYSVLDQYCGGQGKAWEPGPNVHMPFVPVLAPRCCFTDHLLHCCAGLGQSQCSARMGLTCMHVGHAVHDRSGLC